MNINLIGYEKLVIKFGLLIQFTHLKSSSYEEGTKTLESTLDNSVESTHLAGKTSLVFHKISYETFTEEAFS